MLTEILIFSAVFLLLLQYFTQKRPKNFPPGPSGIPILGYLPFLGLEPYKSVNKLSEKYGKILSVYFANYPIVFINDVNLVKEAFKEDNFSGRPPLRPILERSWGKKTGIIFGEGSEWQEQRRFALKTLRDFGFGKTSMESIINEEVVDFINFLKKDSNNPVEIQANVAVINSLWHIISGERYEYNDPKLKLIIKVLIEEFEKTELAGPIFFMPWLTKLLPKLSGWDKFISSLVPTFAFFNEIIDQHKSSYDPHNIRDFIDAYLKEIESTSNPNSSFYKQSGEKSLLIVLLDLFAAGFDTVNTTLRWSFLFLINNPKVQKKLQEEIERVIGKSRLPSVSDKPKMPYMEAFVTETLRRASPPFGVFHSASENVEFHGFTIPKDTVIMPSVWAIHHDPKIFEDPFTFNPERFINPQTGAFKKNDNFIGFSVGKRVCLGETLAREELFLFLAGLLQNLDFLPEKPGLIASEDPAVMSITFKPKPYKVIIQERK